MYEVNYVGWTSYVSNYFYCRIQHDVQRDLLAIDKFLAVKNGTSGPRGKGIK